MDRDVAVLGKAHTVATHLGDNVFPEHDDLLSAVLDAAWVACEDGAGDTLPKLCRNTVGQCRPEINRYKTALEHSKF